jgi:hypothetical protein
MPEAGEIAQLERALAAGSILPEELIRIHERALFLRTYSVSRDAARRAERLLDSIAGRVAGFADRSAFEAPEVSGIAGSSFTAVFSYEVARSLAARHPGVRIDWEAYDEPERMGPVLRRLLPLMGDDWPVEAHTPFREWLHAAGHGNDELRWLLDRIARLPLDDRGRADFYNSMALPLYWEFSDDLYTRTHLRLKRPLFMHKEPLLRRSDVSLVDAFTGPNIFLRRLLRPEAARLLDLILDTSAMRYRELYGFSHPDPSRVRHADLGRGTDFYFFGVPPEWRLPLRAYHAGMFFKNGVPAGYVELLSICDRAEIGFNLYYTFREGETAWLYARIFALFHQLLGINTFAVDPYQIGLENQEAIDSGAFWFYRKLGFRPVNSKIAQLTKKEEQRLAGNPTYRSSAAILRELAAGPLVFEGPEASPGFWDKFEARKLGMGILMEKKNPLARFARLKHGPDEAAWLRALQKDRRIREQVVRLANRAGTECLPHKE